MHGPDGQPGRTCLGRVRYSTTELSEDKTSGGSNSVPAAVSKMPPGFLDQCSQIRSDAGLQTTGGFRYSFRKEILRVGSQERSWGGPTQPPAATPAWDMWKGRVPLQDWVPLRAPLKQKCQSLSLIPTSLGLQESTNSPGHIWCQNQLTRFGTKVFHCR